MTRFIKNFKYTATLGLMSFCSITMAQNGSLNINKDQKIDKVLKVRKTINEENEGRNLYRIQIYSGNLEGAKKVNEAYKDLYKEWDSKLVYQTPNYKIWAGKFRSRLEADRALNKIKEEFGSAFIFKPKKKS